MKYLLPLIVIGLLAAAVLAQNALPDIGSIVDIKGKTKIYVAADSKNAKLINNALAKNKALSVVNKPGDAEFFIEYVTLHHDASAGLLGYEEGEMNVYFVRDAVKVIVWRDSAKNGLKWPSEQLTKRFLKALGTN